MNTIRRFWAAFQRVIDAANGLAATLEEADASIRSNLTTDPQPATPSLPAAPPSTPALPDPAVTTNGEPRKGRARSAS